MHVIKPVTGSISESVMQMHFLEEGFDGSGFVPGGQLSL